MAVMCRGCMRSAEFVEVLDDGYCADCLRADAETPDVLAELLDLTWDDEKGDA